MSITAEDRSLSHAGQVTDPNPEVPERAKRRSYTAKYKLEILAEYEGLDRDGKGGLLRREGLYTSLISEWRKQRDRGALEALAAKAGRPPLDPTERVVARNWSMIGAPLVPSSHGPKYAGGMCRGPRCDVLVSRGAGMSILPLRFRVPPEISLITLSAV